MQQPSDLETVRESYDRVADAYVELGMGRLEAEPWLRAVLAAFAESVRGLGPVLDVGCGPGTVTAHLTELGLDASGVDLSPRMVEHARRQYPDLRFSVASATELDLAPASLGGVLGWWSLFNLPRESLPGVLRTFAEALVPGGQALIGTHVGDGDLLRTEGYGGLPVSWTTHLYRPEKLAGMLVDAGLEVVAELRLPVHPPSLRPQVLLARAAPGLSARTTGRAAPAAGCDASRSRHLARRSGPRGVRTSCSTRERARSRPGSASFMLGTAGFTRVSRRPPR